MSKKTGFHLLPIVLVIFGLFGVIPVQASEGPSPVPAKSSVSVGETCQPDGGWMWANGPAMPDVAEQVQKDLLEKGIHTSIEAKSYGETDSCGTYSHRGVDFTIRLSDSLSDSQASQQSFVDNILSTLVKYGTPTLGNVKLISSQGRRIPVDLYSREPTIQTANVEAAAGDVLTRNVYVIVYDPLLRNGLKLSQYLGWNDHATITQQTVNFFKQATNNRMNYVIAYTTVITNGWPALADGYIYTEDAYLTAVSGGPHHEPTDVDYNKIVNDPQFDLCGKVSRGEIDEVWIYNGPWFGFYESTLAGPGAFWYNSPEVPGPHNCNRLLPIMGPSPERSVDEAVHNFTHRTESTMSKVYGGWQENSISTSWNKFALVKAQSPNFSYSGCGSSHYPPNGTSGYDYSNPGSVLSNCNDFYNYPNLSDPLTVSQSTSCTTWGCSQLGYFNYWFGHFPAFTGCGPDNVANDWWKYLASPAVANYPSNACQTNMHWISGNVGTEAALISYTDGTSKTVTADSSGNYSLMVSSNWSGTVTPFKAGYTFTPSSRSYTGVQSEQYNQNYSALGATKYYVNGVTGNDSNSCITPVAPCRNIQEAINKAGAGHTVYITSGTYLFSTNPSPNVVIVDKNLTISGGWNSDFTLQTGASIIDGASTNNGILSKSGTVVVENIIVQNSISYNGGAIYIINGDFTLRRSTLRNNQANVNGAGIFLDNGKLTVINDTISGNIASGSGGGIYASLNSNTSVLLQNSTIAYNQASTGGGISRTSGTYNITNTIIANNGSTVAGADCYGTVSSAGYNIIENMSGCSITSGNNNLNIDPQIDSNLTGAMLMHVLLPGSPAINAGSLSGCPTTDQRGVARPQGMSCDIGSYELVIDNIAPSVSNVTSSALNAVYKPGSTIPINVTFSEIVNVTGTPKLVLATGSVDRAVNYSTGSGTDTLTFAYTVQTNDVSADLDYISSSALTLNGGTIKDLAGNPAVLVLAVPGTSGSLGANKDLVIDGIAPTLNSFKRQNPLTSTTNADTLVFRAIFSEAVKNIDVSDLAVNGTTSATVTKVSTINASTYDITVSGGDLAGYNGTVGLNLSGSQNIQDLAGNPLPSSEPSTDETYAVSNLPSGTGSYDDSDVNWSYSGTSWLVASGGSFSNNSVHYTSAPGDTASFAFTGTQFKLTYTQATNRGLIAMYVDGNAIGTLNAYGSLVFKKVYTSPVFLSGSHVVQFTNAGGPGPYIDIDGIEILNVTAPGPGIYDDLNANWSYNGASWLVTNGSSFTNNSVHYTNGLGDSASFTFTGTQFVLTYTQATNRGNIDIYVDGAYRATRNANGPLVFQKTYISPILSSGTHVVQIYNAGLSGPYIDIDSIQILNSSIPGAGSYDDADVNWSYSGTSWLVANDSLFSNNSVHYTNGLGDSASFIFNGTQFILTYTQATNRGNIGIYVDGNQIDTLNANGPLMFKKTYTSPVLIPASHVVQFRNAGGSGPYIDIDGIQILYTSIPGAGNYDDTDSLWSYRGTSWLVASGASFSNNSVHYTNGLGDSASFTFTGTQFVLTYTQATNRGNVAIFMDGSQIGTLNEYGSLTFQKTYTSPVLIPGTHVLQFKNAGGPGPYIDIDGIQIINSPMLPAGNYDDADVYWFYSGTSWLVANGGAFSNNSVHYTNGLGDSASFIFIGTQFKLTYTQATNRGNVAISVDGSQIDTLNANGPLEFQKVYTSSLFLPGAHVVQFKNAGGPGPYIDIDGLQIIDTPVSGAGSYDDSNANWSYSGTSWLVANAGSFSNNSVHYTNGLGNSASFLFSGTQFKLTYTQATNRGNVTIFVDGIQIGTLNENGSLVFQNTYSSPALSYRTHVVQFKNAGGPGPYIDIDGIQIN